MDRKKALLEWFDRSRRDFPWRRDTDPYRVWVSEIMLQQTRAETVVPYFETFVDRFPRIEDLAAANLDKVLALWSGLGYYQRARRMHQAAKRIVALGGFPTAFEGLLELPGIGHYTAAAVASIAFRVPVVAVDGNVQRVISRLEAFEGDPRSAASRRALIAAARELLDCERPGDTNQALMDLGAVLCTPRRPRCGECPLEKTCKGRRFGAPERFPKKRRFREVESEFRLAVLVEVGDRLLLFRRPEDAEVLAGTWEIPWAVASTRAETEACLGRRYGGRWRLGTSLGTVRHSITFRDITAEVWEGDRTCDQEIREGREAGWFLPEEIRSLPVSSLVVKLLEYRGRKSSATDQGSSE